MNLGQASSKIANLAFRIRRAVASIVPSGRITAFGTGNDKIGTILVVNLDRQPGRWKQVLRELGRFRTFDGAKLTSIVRRVPAVDARDGRAVAATADVDPIYRIGDQLYVQPDSRLQESFGLDEPIRMTRQEVAVARSHVEVWKSVAMGSDEFVLVLEDDVWFKRGAAEAIDRGWRAALRRCRFEGGPRFLYLSYADADGTAERTDVCEALFRPIRGLWFLSGYVLSREGAAELLRAMPVVGPVDTWINYRFADIGALALSSPAILQRQDSASDNSYSVLPYLARAGIVDAGSGAITTNRTTAGVVLAWTATGEREDLAMALSMIGLRVQVFDCNDKAIEACGLPNLTRDFDVLVDPSLAPGALHAMISKRDTKFIFEANVSLKSEIEMKQLPSSRTLILQHDKRDTGQWEPLCDLLGLTVPIQAYPVGAPREFRIFRDNRVAELSP